MMNFIKKYYKNILVLILMIVSLSEGYMIYRLSNLENQLYLKQYEFQDFGGTEINARGTWTSDIKTYPTLQTSKIICSKEVEGRDSFCDVSTAEVFFKGLNIETNSYKIKTWNSEEVITEPSVSAFGCTEYSIRLDRKNKQVTATRVTLKTTDECTGIEDKTIHLYLADGWDVIKKIRGYND